MLDETDDDLESIRGERDSSLALLYKISALIFTPADATLWDAVERTVRERNELSARVQDMGDRIQELERKQKVKSPEEVDKLPYNTILLDDDGDVYIIGDFGPVNMCAGDGPGRHEPPALPARILDRPQ